MDILCPSCTQHSSAQTGECGGAMNPVSHITLSSAGPQQMHSLEQTLLKADHIKAESDISVFHCRVIRVTH